MPCSGIRSTPILKDLGKAMMQQIFFWGMDASSSRGNLFETSGFRKTRSTGLQGTSCYSLPYNDGEIFLHGACAGWISKNTRQSFLFIRSKGKCFIWKDGTPPVPGEWPNEKLSPVSLVDDNSTYSSFISWVLDHETWITSKMGTSYRQRCYRKYKSLPKSQPWLSPELVTLWLKLFLQNPAQTPRAKHFLYSQTI